MRLELMPPILVFIKISVNSVQPCLIKCRGKSATHLKRGVSCGEINEQGSLILPYHRVF